MVTQHHKLPTEVELESLEVFKNCGYVALRNVVWWEGVMFGVDNLSYLFNLDYMILRMQRNQTFGKFVIAITPMPLGVVS